MKYQIRFLSDAGTDWDDIRAYLSQFYESTATTFFRLLKQKIAQLKDFPYSCPVYEDDPDYRRLVVGDYLVFYRVNESDKLVEIHRIFHGARNIKQCLDESVHTSD